LGAALMARLHLLFSTSMAGEQIVETAE